MDIEEIRGIIEKIRQLEIGSHKYFTDITYFKTTNSTLKTLILQLSAELKGCPPSPDINRVIKKLENLSRACRNDSETAEKFVYVKETCKEVESILNEEFVCLNTLEMETLKKIIIAKLESTHSPEYMQVFLRNYGIRSHITVSGRNLIYHWDRSFEEVNNSKVLINIANELGILDELQDTISGIEPVKRDKSKLLRISEAEFEEFLLKAKSEESLFDFKQGMLQLADDRKFDTNSFEKIMKNVCAMANHGIGKSGRIFIGVTDKLKDAKRIEELDGVKVPILNRYGVCGIERESNILGYDLEQYQNFILRKISESKIPQKLKTHLKTSIGYINYKDKHVLLLELECIEGPSYYNVGELYIRNGPNLNRVEIGSDEFEIVNKRCYIKS